MDSLATAVPEISTARLRLRPVRLQDEAALARHTADVRIARMTTSIPHPLPAGTTTAFITRAMAAERQEDVWIIDGSDHDLPAVLGVLSLKRMDRAQSEIAFWIAPDYWNSGIASEAVQALLAANPTGDRIVFAAVPQDNPGSARVLTNAGFEFIGAAETLSVARNAPVPTWTYLKRLG